MRKSLAIALFAATAVAHNVMASPATMDDVKLFQNFQKDAARSDTVYVDGTGFYVKYDKPDDKGTGILIQSGIPLAENIEVGVDAGFMQRDPDYGKKESGLLDVGVTGKYHLDLQGASRITLGASLTLPVGDEDLGQDKTDFGFFGAVRYPVNEKLVVVGLAGLNFEEQTTVSVDFWGYADTDTDRETALQLGGGAIYRMDEKLHLIGEMNLKTEGDVMALSGGADFQLHPGGRLRGAVTLGLDDGSPDFGLQGGYQIRF